MRHGVILAGGGGTRLWPASRRAHPKQFLALGTGDESLLAATARRLSDSCGDNLWVVTAEAQRQQVRDALPQLKARAMIREPVARNTAAALGLAAVHVLRRDPDAVMAAIPSDQHIADEKAFSSVVDRAFTAAEKHPAIVTVGIVPTRPETGYGYLELGSLGESGVHEVAAFVEKPDATTAERYVASGAYLWNGGMFFTRAQRLLDEIRRHLPETGRALEQIAAALAESESAGQRVADEVYPELIPVSIDHGVMEKTSPVLTVPGDFGWNDVGSWSSLADYRDADSEGNIISGEAVCVDAKNNIIVSDEGTVVALAGVSDLVVVRSGDAVLVLSRERAQDVRRLVAALEKEKLDHFL